MVFVKQVETGMLQCFSRTAKDKWSYIKWLTNHHALIQQLHYCSKVQLSGTDRCYTFKQINLVSWEVDTIYILDTTLVWHLQNIPLSVSKMCLLNPVSCPWRQKNKTKPFCTLVLIKFCSCFWGHIVAARSVLDWVKFLSFCPLEVYGETRETKSITDRLAHTSQQENHKS